MIKIYHNPKCSKSRAAVEYLIIRNLSFEIIEYMKYPITTEELGVVIQKTGKKPYDLIRKKEDLFVKEYKNTSFSDEEWLRIMVENPRLIERPIVVNGNKAVIARPADIIEDIL